MEKFINGKLCKYHHTASRRGYCKVSKIGSFVPYVGKFGRGYIERAGRHKDSTNYETIIYWLYDI